MESDTGNAANFLFVLPMVGREISPVTSSSIYSMWATDGAAVAFSVSRFPSDLAGA